MKMEYKYTLLAIFGFTSVVWMFLSTKIKLTAMGRTVDSLGIVIRVMKDQDSIIGRKKCVCGGSLTPARFDTTVFFYEGDTPDTLAVPVDDTITGIKSLKWDDRRIDVIYLDKNGKRK